MWKQSRKFRLIFQAATTVIETAGLYNCQFYYRLLLLQQIGSTNQNEPQRQNAFSFQYRTTNKKPSCSDRAKELPERTAGKRGNSHPSSQRLLRDHCLAPQIMQLSTFVGVTEAAFKLNNTRLSWEVPGSTREGMKQEDPGKSKEEGKLELF